MSDEAEPKPAAPVAPAAPSRASIAPPSVLSRPTDGAARPGFRSPRNKGSKAQKSGKKK